jgi:hypothetical protein
MDDKLREAIDLHFATPRRQAEFERRFRAVFGFKPVIDAYAGGVFTAHEEDWTINILGQLCYIMDDRRAAVIDSIEDFIAATGDTHVR